MAFGKLGARGGFGSEGSLGKTGLSSAQLTALQTASLVRIKAANIAGALSNPVTNADMVSPPTLTLSTTHDATLTTRANPQANPTAFRTTTGYKHVRTTTNGLHVGTSDGGNGPTPGTTNGDFTFTTSLSPVQVYNGENGNACGHDFIVTNSRFVEFDLRVPGTPATLPYRLIVNDKYAVRDGFFVTASNGFAKFDFGSVQATLNLTLEVQISGNAVFQGISVDAAGTIAAPVDAPVSALWLGDSITEGRSSGDTIFYVFDRFWNLASARLGFKRPQNGGVGQTGWDNNVAGARKRLIDQLSFHWAIGELYDIIFVWHGFNDQSVADATLQARVTAAIQNIRAHQPQALIVIGGIFAENTGPSALIISKEGVIKTGFDAVADPCSIFLRNSTDPGGSWLTGTGTIDAPNASGNSDLYVSADHVHPTRAAGPYLAGKIDTALRAALPAIYTAFGIVSTNFELREDGSFELREDGFKELRE